MSLKQKTISGLFWSSVDSFARQGIQLIVGIILARLLTPREFGLMGMLTIFIAVSQSFIDSGFSSALISVIIKFYMTPLLSFTCGNYLLLGADHIPRN